MCMGVVIGAGVVTPTSWRSWWRHSTGAPGRRDCEGGESALTSRSKRASNSVNLMAGSALMATKEWTTAVFAT